MQKRMNSSFNSSMKLTSKLSKLTSKVFNKSHNKFLRKIHSVSICILIKRTKKDSKIRIKINLDWKQLKTNKSCKELKKWHYFQNSYVLFTDFFAVLICHLLLLILFRFCWQQIWHVSWFKKFSIFNTVDSMPNHSFVFLEY